MSGREGRNVSRGGRGGRGPRRGQNYAGSASTAKKGLCTTLGTNVFDYGQKNATKPLQGALFRKFRDQIMGAVPAQDPGPGKTDRNVGKKRRPIVTSAKRRPIVTSARRPIVTSAEQGKTSVTSENLLQLRKSLREARNLDWSRRKEGGTTGVCWRNGNRQSCERPTNIRGEIIHQSLLALCQQDSPRLPQSFRDGLHFY
jgi:hypothetical protein